MMQIEQVGKQLLHCLHFQVSNRWSKSGASLVTRQSKAYLLLLQARQQQVPCHPAHCCSRRPEPQQCLMHCLRLPVLLVSECQGQSASCWLEASWPGLRSTEQWPQTELHTADNGMHVISPCGMHKKHHDWTAFKMCTRSIENDCQ